jgi:hypothetical protein
VTVLLLASFAVTVTENAEPAVDEVGALREKWSSGCTVTELLAALVAVQLWYTATTRYVYVPAATPVSLQLVPEIVELGDVPQALLVVEPSLRVT